jgi:hypothetical protein
MQQDDTVEQVETRSIPLRFEGKGVELLWRGPVALLLMLLVIPAAWGYTLLGRWFVESIRAGEERQFVFKGKSIEIFGHSIALMLIFALPFLPQILELSNAEYIDFLLQVFSLPLLAYILLLLSRWFASKMSYEDQKPFKFSGSYPKYLKYEFFMTIIGLPGVVAMGIGSSEGLSEGKMAALAFCGAFITAFLHSWVLVIYMKWYSHHFEDENGRFAFSTTPLRLFGRGILYFIFCLPIITIPWATVWFTRQLLSWTTYEEAAPPQFAFAEDAPTASPDSDTLPYPSIFK